VKSIKIYLKYNTASIIENAILREPSVSLQHFQTH